MAPISTHEKKLKNTNTLESRTRMALLVSPTYTRGRSPGTGSKYCCPEIPLWGDTSVRVHMHRAAVRRSCAYQVTRGEKTLTHQGKLRGLMLWIETCRPVWRSLRSKMSFCPLFFSLPQSWSICFFRLFSSRERRSQDSQVKVKEHLPVIIIIICDNRPNLACRRTHLQLGGLSINISYRSVSV